VDERFDHVCLPRRLGDVRQHVRRTLRFVGLEQLGLALALHDERELPREVHRIAQTRAHALTEHRRHLVRRVARKQHAPIAPTMREPRVPLVGIGARDAVRAGLQPGESNV